jgi:thiol-disulfide isomerase/thioredoxin
LSFRSAVPAYAAILAFLTISVGAVAAEVEKPPSSPRFQGGEGARFAEPGMIAPDFSVLDVAKHPFRLSEEVSRKPVILLFWSVFCDPCRAELTNLQMAQDRFAGRDLTVVAVAYGVAVTPSLLLLGKGGTVVLRNGGKVREDELEKAVSSLLKK